MALALLLKGLAEHGGFAVAGLAHFNHRLRPTAERDEAFCRALAARVGLPIVVDSADVLSYAASQRYSVEDAARRLRYDFLERTATAIGVDRIAVGHTEDDQAETYLFKLVRGAGPAGLGGIYPQKGRLIRPLLDVSRADLRVFLTALGESWMEDETNADVTNLRNRLRHVVLPELERAYPGAGAAVARAAGLARDDGQWMDALAATRFAELAVREDQALHIDAQRLAAEPAPIQRRVILLAARTVADGREIGLDHVESVLDVMAGASGGVDIPGGRVELRQRFLVLIGQGARS